MSPKAMTLENRALHWAATVLLTAAVYFLVKIDRKVDTTYDKVIQHEQRITEVEKKTDKLEARVFYGVNTHTKAPD